MSDDTSNVIKFGEAKAVKVEAKSQHFASLDIFYDEDLSVWARVHNAGDHEMDAEWHGWISDDLRSLAWISDGQAAAEGSDRGAPIVSVNLFENSRISVRYNDDLVLGESHLQWIKRQLEEALDEIKAGLSSSITREASE